ncbi:16S rRNA (cytidine(1402)-2'-O)-methyltransferase [Candidatus Woesebacteria bacterium]|nr:16S rRNA (cytidine(1402)-2'-O)-methyltransferase [Candidatus Woesebacteria bacterium]
MSGTLFIVATPIGNLKDMSYRAVEILKNSEIILAEDTRVTGKLLSEYDIHPDKFISFHQHTKDDKKYEVLNHLLKGKDVAYVSDAGTPGISDPGNELVCFVAENNPDIKIVPIPGASAIVTALSVSGMNVNKFVFLGFLPKKKRTKLFAWLKEGKVPFAFYESPNRIIKSLEAVREEFGEDIDVFIARELTKIHESIYRGTVSEVIQKLQDDAVKGEFVVIVDL